MATESDLRDLLRGPGPEGPAEIDVDAVLRRARSRRRPKVVAVSAVGAFALVGAIAPAALIGLPTAPHDTATVLADGAGGGATEEADLAAPEAAYSRPNAALGLDVCGAPLTAVASPVTPLVLEVAPVSAKAGAGEIPVAVTLRNIGTERIVGTAGQPVVTLAGDDGTVLWHGGGAGAEIPVDLDPGEATTFVTSFRAAVCAPETAGDALAMAEELPAAEPGAYLLRSAIDFSASTAAGARLAPEVVSGPPVQIELD